MGILIKIISLELFKLSVIFIIPTKEQICMYCFKMCYKDYNFFIGKKVAMKSQNNLTRDWSLKLYIINCNKYYIK